MIFVGPCDILISHTIMGTCLCESSTMLMKKKRPSPWCQSHSHQPLYQSLKAIRPTISSHLIHLGACSKTLQWSMALKIFQHLRQTMDASLLVPKKAGEKKQHFFNTCFFKRFPFIPRFGEFQFSHQRLWKGQAMAVGQALLARNLRRNSDF